MKLAERYHNFVIGGLEDIFYRWGKFVAVNPWRVILTTFLLPALAATGFCLFNVEYATDKLWIPSSSPFKSNKEWSNEHFSSLTRWNNVLYQSNNVLTPQTMQLMYEVHKKMIEFQSNGKSYKDLCYLVPVQNLFFKENANPSNKTRHAQSLRSTRISTKTSTTTAPSITTTEDYYDDEYSDPWPDYFDNLEDADTIESSSDSEEKEATSEEKYLQQFTHYETSSGTLGNLPSDIYCGLVNGLTKRCYWGSLLELWEYDEARIYNLKTQDILEAINTVKTNPWLRSKADFQQYLGGIKRNASGWIISAEATWVQYFNRVPEDADLVVQGGIGLEFEKGDIDNLNWEQHLIEVSLAVDGRNGTTVLPHTSRSFNDVSFQSVYVDIFKMGLGYVIMFFYTSVMLGRLSCLEGRVYLAGVGIFSCILGLAAALGITFLLGFDYNQTHHVLPFIAIGIGIDDIFVILECWSNIHNSQLRTLSLEEKIARTMKVAGVSVTVTSVTDILAFGLGAFTIMPGLQSFCVSASICIACVFLLQVSWFVAWLTLDQKRIQNGRNAFLPCIKVAHLEETDASQPLSKIIFKNYAELLMKTPTKVFVLLLTVCLLGVGVWGSINIQQRFDPNRMLPEDSYLNRWIEMQKKYFPLYGFGAKVYTGPLDYKDLPALDLMVTELQEAATPGPNRILRVVESWWPDFKQFLEDKNRTLAGIDSQAALQTELSGFLFSVDYARYQHFFKFDGPLVCSKAAPRITATQDQIWYGMSSSLPPPSEYLPAKSRIDSILEKANFSKAFAISPIYQAWETDAIIAAELGRNLGLALLAVAIVSLLFLADLTICILVMLCVLLTLVDLVGVLHFWGMTIDVLSCINIVLATGLSVDYSVHLAHSFIIAKGEREERVCSALVTLGPAIFNGGVTTALALALLPFSSSHVFITFFKVFSLTVVFGLFHGLVFLPVLLAIVAKDNKQTDTQTDRQTETQTDRQTNNGTNTRIYNVNKGFEQDDNMNIRL